MRNRLTARATDSMLRPLSPAYRDIDRSSDEARSWIAESVRRIQAEANRSSDTHLIHVPLPQEWDIELYLKDESTHPTGSLKHRLARSMFLYALCNGWLRAGTPVIEASSGSTAVSEAYFASLIGVPFFAVVARGTSQDKIDLIELHGGRCHMVDRSSDVYTAARQLADDTQGHFMDQFTFAERATDWRGNNNIAESVFDQLRHERHSEPTWLVATAGTGGTSATIGRYLRYTGRASRLCVADPENSAFFEGWERGDARANTRLASRIEGIGRQRVEPSFLPTVIDRMIQVPDAAAVAAIQWLESAIGRRAGGSTGTGLWAALQLIAEMRHRGDRGSVVGLLCDNGERYRDKYYSPQWLADQQIEPGPYLEQLEQFVQPT